MTMLRTNRYVAHVWICALKEEAVVGKERLLNSIVTTKKIIDSTAKPLSTLKVN
jgi:hypothetical protein